MTISMATAPQRVSRVIWCLAAAVAALHFSVTLTDVDGRAVGWVSSGWTPLGVFLACAATCLARAGDPGRQRLAWLALGVGLALYAAGQGSYLLVTSEDPDAGFLSVSTLLWLCLYPAALATITQLVRARDVQTRRDLRLDGAIGGLAIATLGVTVVYVTVIGRLPALDAAPSNVAFATGDLLVVGFGVGACGALGWRPPPSLALLLGGFFLLGVQDVAYLDELLQGTYTVGGVLDSLWLFAVLVITAGAAWPVGQQMATAQPAVQGRIGPPIGFALVAVGLAVYEGFADLNSPLPSVLTGLTLAAVVARFVVLYRDLTSMLVALDRSEAHLAHAQRVARVGSWHVDFVDDRVTWSAEQKRLHGWRGQSNPESFAAVLETIEPADRPSVAEVVERAVTHDERISIDYRVRVAEGEVRWLHGEGEPVRDADGAVIGIVGTSQDTTERFRAAEAERANQAKSEFLSRMSHELRTPLNAILGFGQLLEAARLDEPHRSSVRHILTSGRHLLALVNEVLEISRIESGELAVCPEAVHLRPIVDDAVDLVSPIAGGRGVRVSAHVEAGLWARADPQRLKQVLLNLLSNAVKYNRDGGRVEVRVAKAGGRVRIAVSDTGRGIAPEMLHRLFTPFERLGAERLDVEGTGLGLALSKGLTAAMNGTLEVESTSAGGSTFVLALDAAPAGVTTHGPEPEAPAPVDDGAHRHKLLCVEDDVSNLKLIEQIFAGRPFDLLTAVQGSIGLELAHQHRPDLIVLDLNLPDLDGDEILRRLRDDPATAGIPVVIVSADATQRQVERLLGLGAVAYVTKPIDVGELLRVVDDTLIVPAGRR